MATKTPKAVAYKGCWMCKTTAFIGRNAKKASNKILLIKMERSAKRTKKLALKAQARGLITL